jgi:ATP-dependent DNA helicase RecG
MSKADSISTIKGIGPATEPFFHKIGVRTVQDLIDYYPRAYTDFSEITPIADIVPGLVTLKAKITKISGRYVRRGMHITEAIAEDSTGSVRLVWFNQPYRAQGTSSDTDYFISGVFELSRQKMVLLNPTTEKVSDLPISTARIIPRYKETKGLKSTQIRKAIREVLPAIAVEQETLPPWMLKKNKLSSRSEATRAMHFPGSMKELNDAKNRLGFEEVFELALASLLNKEEHSHEHALQVPFVESLAKSFVSHLPFELTPDQKRVIWQIYQDMQSDDPMNRLVEGDVGSGKTVVATMAALMVLNQGFQVAFMAPTELLARQHAETIHALLKPLQLEHTVGLLVGSLTSAQKKAAHGHIESGKVSFIVGTHALIQEKVDMKNLGLVIIDEQHRFGVAQRKQLQKKAGHMPHVLSMTATPIPRTLALTLYGELDISIIKTKPKGRKPIETSIVSPNSTKDVYLAIDAEIDQGRQVFVVCPLINDSETLQAVHSVGKVHKDLSLGPFKHRKVGLLHGKLPADEKNAIMQDFVDKKLDILVSTTVIEVGVDVPNATIMLIQSADRFGLAQLHQLRGRVGRSEYQGYCYLVLSDSKAPSKRLQIFERNSDGFKLAELDLELRGPGAIYGTFQHGQLDLRVAKLTDVALIESARNAARDFIKKDEKLVYYKHLADRVNTLRSVTNLN